MAPRNVATSRAIAGLCLSLSLIASCTGSTPAPSLPLDYQFPAEEPGDTEVPKRTVTDLSRRVLLIADNQEHFLYGDPIWLRRGVYDKFIGSAVRSPELDLYGEDLLTWILRDSDKRGLPTIHLGDALNVSCGAEMERFTELMKASRKAWFMAPGNHDGFFYGSGAQKGPTSTRNGPDRDWWDVACKNGGGPLDKNAFIKKYLELLAAQADPGARDFASKGLLSRSEAAWEYAGTDAGAILRRVEWKLDAKAFWRSYLVQELDISVNSTDRPRAVRVILVDTSQFSSIPGFAGFVVPGMHDPGSTGSMLEDQFGTVKRWIESDGKATVILMGHHPQSALAKPERAAFTELRKTHGIQLYVSAHTHSSSYFVTAAGDSPQIELNIGSTLDRPSQYRTLSVGEIEEEDGRRRVTIRSPRYQLEELWSRMSGYGTEGFPNCESRSAAWYAIEAIQNHYLDFMSDSAVFDSGPMQRRVMTSLLSAYERLLAAAPTKSTPSWPGRATTDAELLTLIAEAKKATVPVSDQEALLRNLERFEQARTATDEALRREYRLCQAIWASGADKVKARVPDPDDWFVTFPPLSDVKDAPK